MDNHNAGSLAFRRQAVELPQMRIVRWPRNCLGEYATIAELMMTAAAKPIEAHSNHHDPHLPVRE